MRISIDFYYDRDEDDPKEYGPYDDRLPTDLLAPELARSLNKRLGVFAYGDDVRKIFADIFLDALSDLKVKGQKEARAKCDVRLVEPELDQRSHNWLVIRNSKHSWNHMEIRDNVAFFHRTSSSAPYKWVPVSEPWKLNDDMDLSISIEGEELVCRRFTDDKVPSPDWPGVLLLNSAELQMLHQLKKLLTRTNGNPLSGLLKCDPAVHTLAYQVKETLEALRDGFVPAITGEPK
jgi:hypothetical protein